MTILSPQPIHNTKEFNWNPATKTYSAEASTLRGYGHHEWEIGWPKLSAVYDDACDEGFTLVSESTGTRMTMVLKTIDRDNAYAGDWCVLTFVPAEKCFRYMFKVIVFND